ncbi:MAG: radical SAM protein [Phycisphaerales bacterium]|nr:radical SAM protein [Phycisphaerales bacterium]
MFVALTQSQLALRIERARAMLRHCELCELRCGVDRTARGAVRGDARAGSPPPCGLDDRTFCFKRHISYAEELELLPSYMVYFGGCNFRCRFCVQAPGCFAPRGGVEVAPAEAAHDFARVVGRGARTINLLGGEPSMHLHTILEIAAAAEQPLPLALNSNMYMTPEVIEMLDGVVGLYIADLKFGPGGCGASLAGIDRYWEVVTRNLRLAGERAEVLVRHLVMPGHIECCLRPAAEWLAANLPAASFTLMTGYLPAWRARSTPGIDRCLTETETREAERIVSELGLRRSA